MPIAHRLEPIQVNPGAPAKYAVIWLHGLGADGGDFAPLVSQLHLPSTLAVRFIFPHAPIRPITINNGYEMRGWYDIFSLGPRSEIDEEGIQESIEQVNHLIATQVQSGITENQIILGGFSQGAVIAMRTGLQLKKPIAGVIALSGYLPLAQPITHHTIHFPIFLAHGSQDEIVPYALGKAAHHNLQQAGFKVDWHSYSIGHTVNAQEISEISSWMQSVFTEK